jgi:cytochrome c551/c552
MNFSGQLNTRRVRGRVAVVAGLALSFALVLSFLRSSRLIASPHLAQSPKTGAAAPPGNTLSDAQIARMSSDELAKYLFDNHGCRTCHTLTANGTLGFTERGKTLGKGFEGCSSLLTSMSVIAQVPQAGRTADENVKVAKFQQFGCATCHQVTPGNLTLTKYAAKLKSLHMICTEVNCTDCKGAIK